MNVQAEVLRLGGAEVKLQYLELIDNGIGTYNCTTSRSMDVCIYMYMYI